MDVPSPDVLSALDAALWWLEDDRQPMSVGFVVRLGGSMPSAAEVREVLDARLPERMRRRVRAPWRGWRRLRWQAAVPDWDRHLTELPPVGDDAGLAEVVGQLFEQRMDRDRPLFDVHLLGVGDGWALVLRAHHSALDGLAGLDLLLQLLDPTTAPAPPTPTVGHEASARQAASGVMTLVRSVALPERALSGPLSAQREWAGARGDLALARRVAARHGVRVNDVLQECITSGLRELVLVGGPGTERLRHRLRPVATVMPVSSRRETGRGSGGNQVSGVIATLPLHLADPVQRLRAIAADTTRLKTARAAAGPAALLAALDRLPAALTRVVCRAGARAPRGWAATGTTNVPGPPEDRSLLGCPVLEVFPVVPVGQRIRVSVGTVSQGGRLHSGVTTDALHLPGAAVVATGIEKAWARWAVDLDDGRHD